MRSETEGATIHMNALKILDLKTVIERQMICSVNAFRFGLIFLRNRWFCMPKRLNIRGTKVLLQYPSEAGVKTDFVTCVIRNDYGLGRKLGNVKTVLDVGANIGLFALAARRSYPSAIIHAYEPNPRVFPFLTSNTSDLKIMTFAEAIGETDGRVEIEDRGDSNLATTRQVENGSIRRTSLRTAIERLGGIVDLIKMDCEGAEWDLFRDKACWRQIRNIRMEYHLGDHSDAELSHVWEDLGFRVIRREPGPGFGLIWATRQS